MLRTELETLEHILSPKYYMLTITEEEMLGCACFLACKMRNTDCKHTITGQPTWFPNRREV